MKHIKNENNVKRLEDKGRLIDRLVYVAAAIEPLFLYPQAVQILMHKNAQGISIPAWLGIQALTVIWVWYAIVCRQRALLLYQGLYFIANGLIIVGAFMYGGRWF